MDDDLATPAALAAVHETVRAGNTALDAGDRTGRDGRRERGAGDDRRARPRPASTWARRRRRSAVPTTRRARRSARWSTTCSPSAPQARADRDFAAADALRDELTAAGVAVEDTPDGPTWTLKDDA